MEQKLLEALADICYLAGEDAFFTGDSRSDIVSFILWAEEFVSIHEHTDWLEHDYILAITDFAKRKMKTSLKSADWV